MTALIHAHTPLLAELVSRTVLVYSVDTVSWPGHTALGHRSCLIDLQATGRRQTVEVCLTRTPQLSNKRPVQTLAVALTVTRHGVQTVRRALTRFLCHKHTRAHVT